MLSLDLRTFIFTVINVLVLVFFLYRFLFKPVREILAARQNELDNSYREAEEANQKANALKKQYEDTMAQVDAERQEKLEKTRLQATSEYDEIIGNAREKATKIIADAKIEAERQESKSSTRWKRKWLCLWRRLPIRLPQARIPWRITRSFTTLS